MPKAELLALAKKATDSYFDCPNFGDTEKHATAFKAMQELRDAIAVLEVQPNGSLVCTVQPIKFTVKEVCFLCDLIAIPINNALPGENICEQCALYEKDMCQKTNCMHPNVYFKAK